jgi:hypothetical protein
MPQLYYNSTRKLWVIATSGYLFLVLSGALPILIAASAGAIAKSHGCTANEAGSYPCVIGGIDYGGLISIMEVFGWFFLISIPLAFVALFLWTAKVRNGLRFLEHGASYLLTELEDISIREIDGRIYLETKIVQQNNKRSLTITFKHRREQYKFEQGLCTTIKGLLSQTSNGALILYDTVVDSK